MTTIRRKPTLPEAAPPTTSARPRVPVGQVGAAVKPHADWIDKNLGNRDGFLDRDELAAFGEQYGAQAGYRDGVIAPLQSALEAAEAAAKRPAATDRTDTDSTPAQLAARLVDAGGTADASDVAAGARALESLPPEILAAADRADLRVVVCRETVTDYLTELKGVRPRGWPPGATWDIVPGLYDPSRNKVVAATVEGSGGTRRIPGTGEKHGSFDLMFHELAHGLDARDALGTSSRTDAFDAAYETDRQSMEAAGMTYLLQAGEAGHQEAFAESFARYFRRDPTLAQQLPGMYAFWQGVEQRLAGND